MTCILYMIRAGDYLKIGYTTNLDKRLSSIQTGNPLPLSIECALECETVGQAKMAEKKLHSRYKRHRAVGEWFLLPHLDEMPVDVRFKIGVPFNVLIDWRPVDTSGRTREAQEPTADLSALWYHRGRSTGERPVPPELISNPARRAT